MLVKACLASYCICSFVFLNICSAWTIFTYCDRPHWQGSRCSVSFRIRRREIENFRERLSTSCVPGLFYWRDGVGAMQRVEEGFFFPSPATLLLMPEKWSNIYYYFLNKINLLASATVAPMILLLACSSAWFSSCLLISPNSLDNGYMLPWFVCGHCHYVLKFTTYCTLM